MSKAKADKPESVESQDSETVTPQAEPEAMDPQERVTTARAVVDKYAKWSFGVGLIPLPVVDLVALTGVHMKMIHEIAKVYDQSYSDHKIRGTVSALVSGAFPQTVGRAGFSSLLKSIPVFGTAIAMVTMPLTSAAAAYAVGTVFVKHFESGGTLLNVDLKAMTIDVKAFAAKFRKDKNKDNVQEGTDVNESAPSAA